jgi:hypothetical protein
LIAEAHVRVRRIAAAEQHGQQCETESTSEEVEHCSVRTPRRFDSSHRGVNCARSKFGQKQGESGRAITLALNILSQRQVSDRTARITQSVVR